MEKRIDVMSECPVRVPKQKSRPLMGGFYVCRLIFTLGILYHQ